MDLLHRPPEAVVVAERLVDQVEVDVIEAEPLEGPLEGGPRVGLAGVLDPQLGGDEQLVAGMPLLAHGPADRLLVAVGGGGVDVPVADLERRGDRLLGLLRGDLVDAEAEDRHLDAVVEGHGGNGCGHEGSWCVGRGR